MRCDEDGVSAKRYEHSLKCEKEGKLESDEVQRSKRGRMRRGEGCRG